jgi:hypothetical protein
METIMKKLLIIAVAILLAGAIAAGSFYAGMAYKTNQVSQAQANFLSARGQPNGGQFPGNGQNFPGGAPPGGQNPSFQGGGGTAGQVKTIDGNVMTISTAQNVTTVNLTATTQVEQTVSVGTSALQPGMQVMVTGQKDSNGNITASQIRIININPSGTNSPSATGTAP